MERGEADLSRIEEAVWVKLEREGQIDAGGQVGGREKESNAFLAKGSRTRMAEP